MNFRSQKINKNIRRKPVIEALKAIENKNRSIIKKDNKKISLKFLKNKYLVTFLIVILSASSLFAIFKYTPAKTIVTKNILKTIGSDLKKDKEGYTNILAVGVGGEGHEGGQLTDTLLLASINEKKNKVILTSIPRDLYVSHENIISQRINSVYENTAYRLGEEKGMDTLSEIAGQFLGVKVHYYVKIDFKALVDVVNAIDGIEVYNEEAIYDPYYPGPNYSYQTFSLAQGIQYLNGENALKFSRSRKTSSDFARSNRQQQVIFAIKEKALQLGVLSSPEKLQNLFDVINKNLYTSLTFREITSLAAVASDLESTDLTSIVIHDDFNTKGGFLYTPPRSLYRNAFVLLPADKTLSQIHTFIKLHRDFPDLMKNPVPIDILNGTKTSGLAGKTGLIFERFGFEVNQVKNIENRDIEIAESSIQTSIGKDVDIIKAVQELFTPIEDIQYIDPVIPDPTQDGLPSSIKIVAGIDLIETLKYYDVYSSLAPLIQQAIQENRAAQEDANEEEPIENSELNSEIPPSINEETETDITIPNSTNQ